LTKTPVNINVLPWQAKPTTSSLPKPLQVIYTVIHLAMMPTIVSVSTAISGCLTLYWTGRLERMITSGKATPDPSVPPKVLRFIGVGLIVLGVLMFIAQFIVRVEF
jgi:hypothetical protein